MKRNSQYPTDTLFKGIRSLLNSLPTEEEKSELIQALEEARAFLGELQNLVEAFPTAEGSANFAQGLSRLEILADRASSDSHLRKLLGFRASRGTRVSKNGGDDNVTLRAERLAREINENEQGDVTSLLEQSGATLSVLTELATSVGMRTRSKERKADLIRRISTHFTNQRGYKILRGEERVR